jgi:hypothetical protein
VADVEAMPLCDNVAAFGTSTRTLRTRTAVRRRLARMIGFRYVLQLPDGESVDPIMFREPLGDRDDLGRRARRVLEATSRPSEAEKLFEPRPTCGSGRRRPMSRRPC